MEMKKPLIASLIILLAAVAYWMTQGSSPQVKIQSQLKRLTQEAVKPLTLGGIPKIAQINSLRKFFTDDLEVNAYDGRFSLKGKDELMKRLHLGYNYLKNFTLSFSDVNIKLNESEDQATVYLTALASGGGNEWNQAQELKMTFRLESGEWLIASAEAIATLSLD
jgi:hypothetical protein